MEIIIDDVTFNYIAEQPMPIKHEFKLMVKVNENFQCTHWTKE